jgi:hypothetical protein
LSLRIKDLDGGNNVIVVRGGKGNKDRRTLPGENGNRVLGTRPVISTACAAVGEASPAEIGCESCKGCWIKIGQANQ